MSDNEHVCHQCGSCCKTLEFMTGKEHGEIDFYNARGLKAYEYADYLVVIVPHICPQLTEDNKCKIHGEHKPYPCKVWPRFVDGFPEPCIYGKDNGV